MRVLIADKLARHAVAQLRESGFDAIQEPSLSGESLKTRIQDINPSVLVVRSTRVEHQHIHAANALSLVVRAGAGVNTIDLDAAAEQGVFVANCPGRNSIAVAELAFGLLLAVDRGIPDATAALRQGHWNKARFSKADGIADKTIGIAGTGGIGREVIARAKAFGMHVIAYSRSLTPAMAQQWGVGHAESLVDLARRSDVVSIHLPLNEATRGCVNAEVLGALGNDGILLNTSRGEVVDGEALLTALGAGLRAGLDVYPAEPSAKDVEWTSDIAQHPNVVGTPHVGASTTQAQVAVADAVCDVIHAFHTTGTVPNCVNLARRSRANHVLVVRHRDRVGVLASVLEALRRHEINVQEMGNRIFEGAQAASARISVAGPVSEELIGALLALPHILNVSAVPLNSPGVDS